MDVARRVLGLIDLTSLGDTDSPQDVEKLCVAASTPFGNVAAVCVWPQFVDTAVAQLGSRPEAAGIGIAAVANFPHGSTDTASAVADARAIVGANGNEVDLVFPWKALVAGGTGVGASLVDEVRGAIPESTLLKVILETGEIGDPATIRAAALESISAGADVLKTSTGKTAHSATPEAARQLFEIASSAQRPIGVKISGGVRTVSDAGEYLAIADEVIGADNVNPATMRIGASSLLADVLAHLEDSFDPS